MIGNPKKILALIRTCDKKNKYTLNINNSHIPSEDPDILSDVEIDNKQLNAISRIWQKRKGNYNKLFGP